MAGKNCGTGPITGKKWGIRCGGGETKRMGVKGGWGGREFSLLALGMTKLTGMRLPFRRPDSL